MRIVTGSKPPTSGRVAVDGHAYREALGHASARETLDTYGHLWPDSDDLTRQAVGSALAILAASTRRTAVVAT